MRRDDCAVSDASSTKRWQVELNALGMWARKDIASEGRSGSERDNSWGDRRSYRDPTRRGIRGAAFLAVVTLVMPNPAIAGPEIGLTSSGSLEISISVAPRYHLRTGTDFGIEADQHGYSGRLCLETNSPAPSLPVQLLRPSHQNHPSNEMSTHNPPVDWSKTKIGLCARADNHFKVVTEPTPAPRPVGASPSQQPTSLLVLVSPD